MLNGYSSRLPLHWTGKPGMLQARGKEMARVRLMGSWIGTFAVRMRHRQLTPVLASDLRELQQLGVGEIVPLAVLLVMKLKQGVKLEIIDGEHGVET